MVKVLLGDTGVLPWSLLADCEVPEGFLLGGLEVTLWTLGLPLCTPFLWPLVGCFDDFRPLSGSCEFVDVLLVSSGVTGLVRGAVLGRMIA